MCFRLTYFYTHLARNTTPWTHRPWQTLWTDGLICVSAPVLFLPLWSAWSSGMAGMSHITNADAAAVRATTHSQLYGQLASGLWDLEVHGHQARIRTGTPTTKHLKVPIGFCFSAECAAIPSLKRFTCSQSQLSLLVGSLLRSRHTTDQFNKTQTDGVLCQ